MQLFTLHFIPSLTINISIAAVDNPPTNTIIQWKWNVFQFNQQQENVNEDMIIYFVSFIFHKTTIQWNSIKQMLIIVGNRGDDNNCSRHDYRVVYSFFCYLKFPIHSSKLHTQLPPAKLEKKYYQNVYTVTFSPITF